MYQVTWTCKLNGESRKVEGDYMSCCVTYNIMAASPETDRNSCDVQDLRLSEVSESQNEEDD